MIVSCSGTPWEQLYSFTAVLVTYEFCSVSLKYYRLSNRPVRGMVSDTFLSARNPSAADIRGQFCEIYGATAMCESKMRKWVRDFKAGRDSFGWVVLNHFPYTLDLTPCDLHLFCYPKRHLGSNHYNAKEVIKTAVNFWLLGQATSFFDEDLQNSVVRYDPYLNKHTNYAQK